MLISNMYNLTRCGVTPGRVGLRSGLGHCADTLCRHSVGPSSWLPSAWPLAPSMHVHNVQIHLHILMRAPTHTRKHTQTHAVLIRDCRAFGIN